MIWSARARADLAAIDDHYAVIAPDYARRVGHLAIEASAFLTNTPHAGVRLSELGARKWRVRGTPYLLIYRVAPESVEILSVRHAAEDWREP